MKYTAEQVYDALQEAGADAHDDYSGRFMYGKQCPSFECDSESEAFRLFVELTQLGYSDSLELARYLAKNARTDSMGRGMVVYWPDITYTRRADEEAA